jgi:hypothetical protein
MRRRILAAFLGVAGLLSFAAGFHSLRHHRAGHFYGHGSERRAAFAAHVAEVCTRAAEKLRRESVAPGPAPAP